MFIVAGLSLNNLEPRVWDSSSPYYLPNLQAVMVSYADFHRRPGRRRRAMELGLHSYLGIPKRVKIYLDNGAFYFMRRIGDMSKTEYEEFIGLAKPDWYPIPQDRIPTPDMTKREQRGCFSFTMQMNRNYHYDGYTSVIHIGEYLKEYTSAILSNKDLANKKRLALGGIVPNLLRAPKAVSYTTIFTYLKHVREVFHNRELHVFGIGGTATLHISALFNLDSVDSSGWRNRAARGMIQLPGSGERMVKELGSWRGRALSRKELKKLQECPCPACQHYGLKGLRERGIKGFCNRATHNLATLLDESKLIEDHLAAGTYKSWYSEHLDNTIYRPLIDKLVEAL